MKIWKFLLKTFQLSEGVFVGYDIKKTIFLFVRPQKTTWTQQIYSRHLFSFQAKPPERRTYGGASVRAKNWSWQYLLAVFGRKEIFFTRYLHGEKVSNWYTMWKKHYIQMPTIWRKRNRNFRASLRNQSKYPVWPDLVILRESGAFWRLLAR